MQYQQIQLDYRTTLDEKEELISDRDYYKSKLQRLNHQMSFILSNTVKTHVSQSEQIDQPKPIVDIDALLTENKYLHERITQLQVEKEIVKRTLTKYKVCMSFTVCCLYLISLLLIFFTKHILKIQLVYYCFFL